MVAVEGRGGLGAVVEDLGGDLRGEIDEGWLEALEEGGGRIQEDAAVGGRVVDLRGDVLELGDARDLVMEPAARHRAPYLSLPTWKFWVAPRLVNGWAPKCLVVPW